MGFRNPVTTAVDPTARQLANEALTQIIPGSRLAADAIDGKVITGATLRTAAAGQRVVIDSANNARCYTGDAQEVAPGTMYARVRAGSTPALDRPELTLDVPSLVNVNHMALTLFGASRDGSVPAGASIAGPLSIQSVNSVNIYDSDWLTLTPASGWGGGMVYRILSGVTYVSFVATKASYAAGEVFLTIPSQYTANVGLFFWCGYAGVAKEVNVNNSTGQFSLAAAGSGGVSGMCIFPTKGIGGGGPRLLA